MKFWEFFCSVLLHDNHYEIPHCLLNAAVQVLYLLGIQFVLRN